MSSTVGGIKTGRHGFDITAIGGDGVTSVAHISVAAFGPVDGLCYVRPLFRDKGPVFSGSDLSLQRNIFISTKYFYYSNPRSISGKQLIVFGTVLLQMFISIYESIKLGGH